MTTCRPEYHVALAEHQVDDALYGQSTYYYFLGKVAPDGTTPDDVAAPDPEFTLQADREIRDEIVYATHVTANDISLVARCHKWEHGASYAQWDDRTDMSEQNFYVVTSEYNVYKCLNNGSKKKHVYTETGLQMIDVIPPSTVEPSGQFDDFRSSTDGTITTSDGYVWKYMYTIPYIKRKKFMNSRWIPVQKSVKESFYTNGRIESVVVTDQGSGYNSDPRTWTTVSGGCLRPAKVNVYVSSQTGEIETAIIEDAGAGYASAPEISVHCVNPYASGKYGDNAAAQLTCQMANDLDEDGKPILGSYHIDYVTIVDPGKNYLAEVKTTLTWKGDGTGASLYPVIDGNGRIVAVKVAEGGYGYTYLDIKAVSYNGEGSGAEFKAVIGGSSLETDQSLVEQTAKPGGIYAIKVEDTGAGYTEGDVVVTVTGDGSGCTAHAVLGDYGTEDEGRIVQIVVDSIGSDYTYADVKITRTWTIPGYEDASARAIMTPFGGHGSNAPQELFARTVSYYVNVRDDDDLVNGEQDFRQFGMIMNLRTINGTKLATESVSTVFEMTLRKVLGLVPDDIVTIDGSKFRVLTVSGNAVQMLQLSSIYKDITQYSECRKFDEKTGVTTIYEIESVDSVPTVDKYSGTLVFTGNKPAFVIDNGRSVAMRAYFTY